MALCSAPLLLWLHLHYMNYLFLGAFCKLCMRHFCFQVRRKSLICDGTRALWGARWPDTLVVKVNCIGYLYKKDWDSFSFSQCKSVLGTMQQGPGHLFVRFQSIPSFDQWVQHKSQAGRYCVTSGSEATANPPQTTHKSFLLLRQERAGWLSTWSTGIELRS